MFSRPQEERNWVVMLGRGQGASIDCRSEGESRLHARFGHSLSVRFVGYAVDGYRCPPCPKGAMCKPCFMPSALFLFDAPTHAPVDVTRVPPDIFILGALDPDKFVRGAPYRFELTTTSRQDDAVDGSMIRSQRPDLEPIWTDNPSATQERPAVVGPVK